MKVDVRIVAASNRNLKDEVAESRFRADLFYRLNVVHVLLPPLRERADDVPLLVNHFLAKYARENGQDSMTISSEAMKRILEYHWPGNVRELENVIERAIILSDMRQIQPGDLPSEVREPRPIQPPTESSRQGANLDPSISLIDPGDRLPASGFKVRQMHAIDFIKSHGFITNRHYSQLADISERQALRELNELVETGRLARKGKGRACRYVLRSQDG